MVPLGNVAFTFSFMPEHQPLHSNDIFGLLFIMLGLFVYRFMENMMTKSASGGVKSSKNTLSSPDELNKALIMHEDGESAHV
jgi:hypothetical protein